MFMLWEDFSFCSFLTDRKQNQWIVDGKKVDGTFQDYLDFFFLLAKIESLSFVMLVICLTIQAFGIEFEIIGESSCSKDFLAILA